MCLQCTQICLDAMCVCVSECVLIKGGLEGARLYYFHVNVNSTGNKTSLTTKCTSALFFVVKSSLFFHFRVMEII